MFNAQWNTSGKMQRKSAMVDCAMFFIKNKEQRCYTSPNANLNTCTYNFYLSLHTQKSSPPDCFHQYALYTSVLNTVQHSDSTEHAWQDDPLQVHFPCRSSASGVYRGPYKPRPWLSGLTLKNHTSRQYQGSGRCQMSDRWSARLTPGRLWVYLVVRECPELTWLLLNGWKI